MNGLINNIKKAVEVVGCVQENVEALLTVPMALKARTIVMKRHIFSKKNNYTMQTDRMKRETIYSKY